MSARTTHTLLAVAGCLAVLDVALHWPTSRLDDGPTLPAIESAERVQISHGDERVELEHRDDRWHLLAPVEAAADPSAVSALLASFARPQALGVAVDEGHLDAYTLTGHDAIHLTVHDADGDTIDLWIGSSTAGGRSWVRRDGEDAVYRLSLGGRTRWMQSASALRDRSVMQVAPDAIRSIQVKRGPQTATATRTDDTWTLAEQPALPLDPLVMAQLAEALGAWSGQRVVSADDPATTAAPVLTVSVDADTQQQADVVRTADGWFARRQDGTTVTIDPAFLQALADPLLMWRDRRLTTLDPETIETLTVSTDAGTASWQLTDGGWTQVEPQRRAAPDRLDAAVRQLAELRVVGWLTRTEPPALDTIVSLRARGGDEQQFRIGPALENGSIPAHSSITGAQTGTIDSRTAALIRSLQPFIE